MELDVPVVCFDPAAMDWSRLNRADANIYNIGNNATFHRAIFDVARRAPGIVVLHDTRLQHFFARYSETAGADRGFYLDSMRRAHGPAALADAERWLAGEGSLDTLVERYPMDSGGAGPCVGRGGAQSGRTGCATPADTDTGVPFTTGVLGRTGAGSAAGRRGRCGWWCSGSSAATAGWVRSWT